MKLIDSTGQPIQLGNLIGKGGEGNVYEVDGDPSLVAKIYHQVPLPEEQFCKLELLIARRTDQLSKIAAWPTSILRQAGSNEPCGFLMPKVNKARHLHELYGTTNRRMHFPEVRWHHLLLAARNLAAAFHSLHEAGIVIGDINQGNLMVNKQYGIQFIDCDSFQITDGDKTYFCPVGTPHFTPPELQSKKLGGVTRTLDHDLFGLATLIFHLVFVGRHPFAGRFRGEGDLLIEEAIAERRFAFARDKNATMVDPPPYSLQLDDLPQGLAQLFETALQTGGTDGITRPTTEQWVAELDALMMRRAACDLDDLHIYYKGLKTCPWCRIEEEGGPAFFVQESGSSMVSDRRLEMLDSKVNALRPITYPDLPPSQVTPPETVALKQTSERSKIGTPDVAAILMIVAAVLCLLSALSGYAWIAGTLLALGAGAYLLLSKPGKARRQKLVGYDNKLAQFRNRMLQVAHTITAKHQQRKKNFDANLDELRQTIKRYCTEGDQLEEVLRQQTGIHKNKFLRGHMLRDYFGEIPGLAQSMIPMLESYGVESALDVHKLGVYGVPIITPELALEMLQWREILEQRFVFKPEHGVTVAELKQAKNLATRRFKTSQARKILIGAKHLESITSVAKTAQKRSLREFEALSTDWKAVAREKGTYQNSRTKPERLINTSPATLIGVAAGIPILCGILSLLFG